MTNNCCINSNRGPSVIIKPSTSLNFNPSLADIIFKSKFALGIVLAVFLLIFSVTGIVFVMVLDPLSNMNRYSGLSLSLTYPYIYKRRRLRIIKSIVYFLLNFLLKMS